MHLMLLVFGVIASVAGAALIGLGIPDNRFGTGNTFITTGTIAFVGGLILIGLAETVKLLRRIAEGTDSRPAMRAPRAAEMFSTEAPERSPAGRISFPPKPSVEPRLRDPAPLEPRVTTAPSLDGASEEQFDRPPPSFMRREETERPLQPEPRFAAKPAREDDDLSQNLLATAFSRLDVSLRPAPPTEPPAGQPEMFESFWPESRSGKQGEPPQAEQVPSPMVAESAVEKEPEPEPPYAVSILKSGVVDGMAYTLYSDGSIEAEMPQGTMRFASITELRAYLERSP